MEKFLSDKRLLLFLSALLTAIGGWGVGFAQWSEMFKAPAIFGLLIILGSVLGANVTNNVFKTPPVMTETVTPQTTTTVVTSTLKPEGKP
jgi:hypothetical protein